MIIIKYSEPNYIVKLDCGATFKYNDINDDGFRNALNLCRCRLDKFKEHEFEADPLIVIRIPFVKCWLVW